MRWHRNVAALALLVLISAELPAQSKPATEGEVKAMLLLAKAKRQREEIVAAEKAAKDCQTATGCYTDLPTAEKVAKDEGKKLVYWVAMTCEEAPAVRAGLTDVVNVHVPELFGLKIPRVAFPVDGGMAFESIKKTILSADDLALIREKMGLPQVPKN